MGNKLIRFIKKIIRKFIPKKKKRTIYNPDGKKFYDPNKEMSFQSYFEENKEKIFQGEVPERYKRISDVVPGNRVLEIGVGDGTQSLILSLEKEKVYAIELMNQQFSIANKLKDTWLEKGIDVSKCEFINDDIIERVDLFEKVDTILMSRVVYHLMENISSLFSKIKKNNIEHVVLVGCPRREERWKKYGDTGDPLGKYAFYASQEGMEKLLTEFGFSISLSIPSTKEDDPIVVGSRKLDVP